MYRIFVPFLENCHQVRKPGGHDDSIAFVPPNGAVVSFKSCGGIAVSFVPCTELVVTLFPGGTG